MPATATGRAWSATALVTGRFMNDEWTDVERRGITDNRGIAVVRYAGAPCTGALAFLVTDLAKDGRMFDRVNGVLQRWMIPL